jgi:hypothetical protein
VESTLLADAARAKGLSGRRKKYFCGHEKIEYQARVAAEGVPLRLEVTTAYSMRLYERSGFGIVGEDGDGKEEGGC